MTIVEKKGLDSPWLFRTQALQTGLTESMRDIPLQLARIPTPAPILNQQQQLQRHPHQPPPPIPPATIYLSPNPQQQRLQQIENLRSRVPNIPNVGLDPRKVVKSSTAPNLPTSHSHSEMFRVI